MGIDSDYWPLGPEFDYSSDFCFYKKQHIFNNSLFQIKIKNKIEIKLKKTILEIMLRLFFSKWQLISEHLWQQFMLLISRLRPITQIGH